MDFFIQLFTIFTPMEVVYYFFFPFTFTFGVLFSGVSHGFGFLYPYFYPVMPFLNLALETTFLMVYPLGLSFDVFTGVGFLHNPDCFTNIENYWFPILFWQAIFVCGYGFFYWLTGGLGVFVPTTLAQKLSCSLSFVDSTGLVWPDYASYCNHMLASFFSDMIMENPFLYEMSVTVYHDMWFDHCDIFTFIVMIVG